MIRWLKARARLRRLRERERMLLFVAIAEAAGGLAQICRDPWTVIAVSDFAEEDSRAQPSRPAAPRARGPGQTTQHPAVRRFRRGSTKGDL